MYSPLNNDIKQVTCNRHTHNLCMYIVMYMTFDPVWCGGKSVVCCGM